MKKSRPLPRDPPTGSSLGLPSSPGPGPPSPRMRSPSPRLSSFELSPNSPSPRSVQHKPDPPWFQQNSLSTRLKEAERLSPTGRVSPQYPADQRYSFQGKSPPGMIFSTRSNLEITHYSRRGESGEQEEEESPLRECSSPLQEIPLSIAPQRVSVMPASSQHITSYNQPLSAGSVNHLSPHGGEYRLRASSMKHLSTPHGEASRLRSASSMKHLTTPHPEGRKLRSASSMKQLPGSSILASELQTRTASQPELHINTTSTHQRNGPSEGLVSLSLPSSPLFTTSSEGNLSHLGGEEGGGEEIAVLDIYILKQATNFYYLLEELWNDVRIVSGILW